MDELASERAGEGSAKLNDISIGNWSDEVSSRDEE
jgi:hypothetical protein